MWFGFAEICRDQEGFETMKPATKPSPITGKSESENAHEPEPSTKKKKDVQAVEM